MTSDEGGRPSQAGEPPAPAWALGPFPFPQRSHSGRENFGAGLLKGREKLCEPRGPWAGSGYAVSPLCPGAEDIQVTAGRSLS